MTNPIFIRANVVCHRTRKGYLYPMSVTIIEHDGVPAYPPETSGCSRCTLSAPCPACVAFVVNEVFRALPLANRSTIEIDPPFDAGAPL